MVRAHFALREVSTHVSTFQIIFWQNIVFFSPTNTLSIVVNIVIRGKKVFLALNKCDKSPN